MTELRPTSLPVPAVVGIAMHEARPPQSAPKSNSANDFSGPLIRKRSALPTSSALPPPKAMTPSQRWSRNAAAAASTSSAEGIGLPPENTGHFPCEIFSSAARAGVPTRPRSVTMSGREILRAANCCGNSFTAPMPKRILVGKENVEVIGPGRCIARWCRGTALGEVSVQRSGEKVVATVDGKKIFEYQAEAGRLPRANIKPAFLRGGFIHPIFTPAGKIISDSYATNHLHQHGIWFAWTKTEFEGRQPDFWNMGEGKGKVEFVAVDKIWSGATEGGFVARHRYIDLASGQPKPVLNETWEVKVYKGPGRSPSANMFDLICTQECATTNRLKLPQYYYGGLGFRGR